MAPSSGYHIVPKAVRAVKYAIARSTDFVRARLITGAAPKLEAVPAHIQKQSIHPLALLRQSRARIAARQTRLFSTARAHLGELSRVGSGAVRSTTGRSAGAFAASATRSVLQKKAVVPFASPLRPNLTGGTLCRSAGGYGLGGGARYFSHTGAAQAHVVPNVHAAVRAFLLQGKTPMYAGNDPQTGAARFRAAGPAEARTHTQLAASSKLFGRDIRGTSLDFPLAPTVALSPDATLETSTLQGLASDFAHQLRDLAAVHQDLKRLGQLGALAITQPDRSTLRVRFPGCDAAQVAALCDEVGVTRGVVREDDGWRDPLEVDAASAKTTDRDVDMALLFPWAPSSQSPADQSAAGRQYYDGKAQLEWRSMLSPPSSAADTPSHSFAMLEAPDSPCSLDLPSEAFESEEPLSAFESLAASEAASEDGPPLEQVSTLRAGPGPTGYEGVEGIYRFLREIESAEGRI